MEHFIVRIYTCLSNVKASLFWISWPCFLQWKNRNKKQKGKSQKKSNGYIKIVWRDVYFTNGGTIFVVQIVVW